MLKPSALHLHFLFGLLLTVGWSEGSGQPGPCLSLKPLHPEPLNSHNPCSLFLTDLGCQVGQCLKKLLGEHLIAETTKSLWPLSGARDNEDCTSRDTERGFDIELGIRGPSVFSHEVCCYAGACGDGATHSGASVWCHWGKPCHCSHQGCSCQDRSKAQSALRVGAETQDDFADHK